MSAPTLRAARRRAGNRAYTGNSGADTWRCTDGWLSTAANTPAQFRVLAQALDLGRLCEDDGLLDVAAFRPSGCVVVQARKPETVPQPLREAFAMRSARVMAERLCVALRQVHGAQSNDAS